MMGKIIVNTLFWGGSICLTLIALFVNISLDIFVAAYMVWIILSMVLYGMLQLMKNRKGESE